MYPDYDGLRERMQHNLNVAEREMLEALTDAMRDDEVTPCTLRYEWVICDVCRGNGGHSRRLGVIDPSDWDEETLGWYREGVYNQPCERCDGSGKVRELDEERLPDEVRAWIDRYRQDQYECEMISYHERLAGA